MPRKRKISADKEEKIIIIRQIFGIYFPNKKGFPLILQRILFWCRFYTNSGPLELLKLRVVNRIFNQTILFSQCSNFPKHIWSVWLKYHPKKQYNTYHVSWRPVILLLRQSEKSLAAQSASSLLFRSKNHLMNKNRKQSIWQASLLQCKKKSTKYFVFL